MNNPTFYTSNKSGPIVPRILLLIESTVFLTKMLVYMMRANFYRSVNLLSLDTRNMHALIVV